MLAFHDAASRRELAVMVWEACHGLPYIWGGDDTVAGFDCSGLVIEGLKAAGVLPHEGDWTAAGLADRFRESSVQQHEVVPGCLLFWERGRRIGHVEAVVNVFDRQPFTIGASGGGSRNQTREDAIRGNAYVKVRPARPLWSVAVDPFRE